MSQVTATNLQKVPLLSVIPVSGLELIAGIADRKFLRPGEVLFQEGKPSETIFFIIEGRIALSMRSDEGRIAKLSALEGGEVLGQMALLENKPVHLCTAVADAESLVIEISAAAFQKLSEEKPKLGVTVQKIIRSDLDKKLAAAGPSLRPLLIRALAT